MCESTNFIAKLNNNEDALEVADIIRKIASKRKPVYSNEIIKFIDGIEVDDCTVKIEDNYSLMSSTFCELISQIMMEIARYNFGAITMYSLFESENCGYEAEFDGRVFKNGKFRLSFREHE